MVTSNTKPIRAAGDKTREKIIKAAKGLFAKHGFSGTSISQIADKAHINRSLIFHHFVNKEELWKVVKQSFMDNILQDEDLLQCAEKGLQHFVESAINFRVKMYENNPDLTRMITWQHMEENASELQGGTKLTAAAAKQAIELLQQRGEIAKQFDPELVFVLISNSVSGPLLARPKAFRQNNKKQEYFQMLIDGICKMLKG